MKRSVFYSVLLAILVSTVGMVASLTSGQTSQVTLTWSSNGGAYGKAEDAAWLTPYQKQFPNVKILYDPTDDPQKLIQMVESGNVSWDVVTLGNDFGLGSTEKYLEKIDCSIVPCTNLQPDKYLTNGYRAPQSSSGTVMAWNKQKLGTLPPPRNC